MEREKVSLLFGELPAGVDPDDPDQRSALFEEQLDLDEEAPGSAIVAAAYEVVANQIADEDPPEVWATARRLTGLGLDRTKVLWNLVRAVLPEVRAVVEGEGPLDARHYAASLGRLPLPEPYEVEKAFLTVVAEHQPVSSDVAEQLVADQMGLDASEEPHLSLLESVNDDLVDSGLLEMLPPDRLVHPASLCSDAVLTHRLTDAERRSGRLTIGVDLPAFVTVVNPRLASDGARLDPSVDEHGQQAWQGPGGWLDGYSAGEVLAVRCKGGAVTVDALNPPPTVDPGLVAALRAVYDREVEEPGLPVATRRLLLGMLADDRTRFRSPQAPLSDLAKEAGLELRGDEVAHDRQVWETGATAHRQWRIISRLPSPQSTRALDALECFHERTDDPERLRQALTALGDPEVAEVVGDELLDGDTEHEADEAEEPLAFAERLAAAARRPPEAAPARWLMALAHERLGDIPAAEAQLHLALEAAPGWEPAAHRLAWYLSDRGRASDAARMLRSLGYTAEDHPDLAIVEPFTRAAGAKLGRNDPCWCGSGRKYKVCHLGEPPRVPLPDRVEWLWRKAAAYLERRGAEAQEEVLAVAAAKAEAAGDDLALRGAWFDHAVIDLVLTEGGWFRRFLDDRGALLPDDEALLGEAWTLVDRSLYEVIDVRPGSGLTLRDLRSAEEVEVRDKASWRRPDPGAVICARAVPDGEGHQLLGAVFDVRAGRERDLLDVLDEGNPYELAGFLGSLQAPPTLVTRENEPLVACTAVLTAPEQELRKVLDAHYEQQETDSWVELHSLNADDDVVRATLRLDGPTLTVETSSEPRMDRVLDVLRREVPDASVVSDRRDPVRPGHDPARSPGSLLVDLDTPEMAAMEKICDQAERRWCDESVPALDGVTPRQAAGDPTRREALERLLREFDEKNRRLTPGAFSFRTDRLRQHLGLR